VVLTSQNAVTALGRHELPGLRAYCVGDKTAQAAAELGLDAVSAEGNVEDLARLIAQDPPTQSLLHIRGDHVAGDLGAALKAEGIALATVTAYRQASEPLTQEAVNLLCSADTVVIPVFSPRSGALLVKQFSSEMTARRIAVCLSQSIADSLDPACFDDIRISDETNGLSLRDCVASCVI